MYFPPPAEWLMLTVLCWKIMYEKTFKVCQILKKWVFEDGEENKSEAEVERDDVLQNSSNGSRPCQGLMQIMCQLSFDINQMMWNHRAAIRLRTLLHLLLRSPALESRDYNESIEPYVDQKKFAGMMTGVGRVTSKMSYPRPPTHSWFWYDYRWRQQRKNVLFLGDKWTIFSFFFTPLHLFPLLHSEGNL